MWKPSTVEDIWAWLAGTYRLDLSPEEFRAFSLERVRRLGRGPLAAVGNDGLTDAERSASAERWRNGAGKAPSKEEMARLREMTPVTWKSRRGGDV